MSAVDLEHAEEAAVTHARLRAFAKVLNEMPVQRVDTAGYTADGRAQSLNAWSRETGIPRATISVRIKLGWPPEQAVGLVSRPLRDYHEQHRGNSLDFSSVIVVDGDRPLTQPEAANILGCTVKSLQRRLVRFRLADRQATVQLAHLRHLTEKHRIK